MKITQSFCLSWLVLTCATTAVHGQPYRTDINPALTYYQAFNAAPDISAEDRDYLFTNEWPNQKLPERFGKLVSGYDNEFRLLRQAALSTVPCDWGIDFNAGPETLLGHLAPAKKAVQAARLRVMWDLQQNDQTNACADLLAALALGRNVSADGSLISVLVQFAVERIVCITVGENFNHFSPESLAQIAARLDGPPPRGTVASAGSTENYFRFWFTNRIAELQVANPGSDDAKVMEGFHRLWDSATGGADSPQETKTSWTQIIAASGGTSDGVIKLFSEMDPWYSRLVNLESLPRPQYEEEIKGFMADVTNSPNPFVREFFSAWQKCRPKEFGATADLAMVQAAIQYKLRGRAGLNSVTNPLAEGPFGFQRFMFDGVDRGFELNADYSGNGYPEVFIFVETDGPPFAVFGKNAGKTPKP
jgi:hypothetical protein